MRQLKPFIVLAALILGGILWSGHGGVGSPASGPMVGTPPTRMPSASASLPSFLPSEVRGTLHLIAAGGPFPHRQDGVIFGNHEGRLPRQPRGYYHEYTVDTPDARSRGARRVITGSTPASVYYYTGDHYQTFQPFEVRP